MSAFEVMHDGKVYDPAIVLAEIAHLGERRDALNNEIARLRNRLNDYYAWRDRMLCKPERAE